METKGNDIKDLVESHESKIYINNKFFINNNRNWKRENKNHF